MILKKLFTISILLSANLLFSQTISRSNLASAGDISTNSSGVSVSWTIGEVFSNTVKNENHITGGFQQGILFKQNKIDEEKIIIPLPEQDTKSKLNHPTRPEFQVTLFPNPTVDQLWVKSISTDSHNLTLRILDSSGKIFIEKNITLENSEKVKINQIEKLAPGHYILHLFDNQSIVSSKSFIKI